MESLNQFPEDVAPSALQVSFGIKALTHSILHIFYSFLSLLASYFWHASIIPLFKRLCFYVLLAFLCSFCLSHILLFLVDWVVKNKVFSPCHYPIQRFNRRQSLCSSRSRWPQQGLSQNFHSHSHFVRSASWCHMIIMTHVLRSWFKIHHVRKRWERTSFYWHMPVILKYRDSAETTQSFENGAYTRLKTRDRHEVNIHEMSPCA